jgi:hypothetical protein
MSDRDGEIRLLCSQSIRFPRKLKFGPTFLPSFRSASDKEGEARRQLGRQGKQPTLPQSGTVAAAAAGSNLDLLSDVSAAWPTDRPVR